MQNHYGVNPSEVFWVASGVGLVVGYSYICNGPLLLRAASVDYVGKSVSTPGAGHRRSACAMEVVIGNHPYIAECAVVGKADALKEHMPLGFIATSDGSGRDAAALEAERIKLVYVKIGAVAAFKCALEIKHLPQDPFGYNLARDGPENCGR